jgi:molybdopterin synthase sulfur carrier subunit
MAFLVKIRYLAVLKGLAKEPEKTVELEGRSLADLLALLKNSEDPILKARFFNEGEGIRPDVLIFVNDVDSSLLGGSNAELKDGDEVVFLPSVHGG